MKAVVIGASVLLAACVSSRTTIESSWSDEAYAGPPLDRLAVIALFETRADSLSFERSAAEYLATQGVEVVPGHELLAPEQTQRMNGQQVLQYVLNIPPEVLSSDAAWWYYRQRADFYSYWRSSADVTAAPGYWLEQRFVVAETALFANRGDRLLWTAKSATMDDERFKRTSESIVRTVARQLFAKDLIARTAESSAPTPPPERG